ncbi:hypothetical protein RHMOL_Rhmol12G0127700 [Rhododendron molle]|uniref:Uncharacterized protein n=1 Tax=Rhododendron molle TaxID=49168 RepID=A0ACC0LHQ3_RHOML|nr:hypothetical protein RHMOL_Rhmol12G0127700 [Rhododendron molle]
MSISHQQPRPELSPNPNFCQTHINNINRLVRGNDIDCHDQHFNVVLQAALRLYNMLLVRPEPVPPNYQDSRWSWFQEGSATDSRIFQHSIERPDGLIVPLAMDTNEVEVVEGPTKQKRRSWRTKEEDALMKCMVNELVGDKWRAENEFKCDFFNYLEKELEKLIPGNDIKQIIFGKDRATGERAKAPAQMVRPCVVNDQFTAANDFYAPFIVEEFIAFLNQPPLSPATPATPIPPTFTSHSSLPTSVPHISMPQLNARGKKGRKRTRMGDEELSMLTSMQNWITVSSDHMENLVNSFRYESYPPDALKCKMSYESSILHWRRNSS